MNYKTIDQVISTGAITVIFMLTLSVYFVIDAGVAINIKSHLVINYILIPIFLVVFFVLRKLNLTLLDDLI